MRELKAIGAHNVTQQRARGLSGKSRFRTMELEYERHRLGDVLPASYEVVYGHAWSAAEAQQAISVSLDAVGHPPTKAG
ncbi:MAG: hypothetical protein P8019_11175 [Gammaproteobacteria bacterium]